jgi:hypothetical protein
MIPIILGVLALAAIFWVIKLISDSDEVDDDGTEP